MTRNYWPTGMAALSCRVKFTGKGAYNGAVTTLWSEDHAMSTNARFTVIEPAPR